MPCCLAAFYFMLDKKEANERTEKETIGYGPCRNAGSGQGDGYAGLCGKADDGVGVCTPCALH